MSAAAITLLPLLGTLSLRKLASESADHGGCFYEFLLPVTRSRIQEYLSGPRKTLCGPKTMAAAMDVVFPVGGGGDSRSAGVGYVWSMEAALQL